jgi:hypothetical protein
MKEMVFICSPLEEEYVARIRATDPAHIEVLYAPDLLPPTRYRNDHKGVPFTRTPAQRARWQDLASAHVDTHRRCTYAAPRPTGAPRCFCYAPT